MEDVVPLVNEAHLRTATPMQIKVGWSSYSFDVPDTPTPPTTPTTSTLALSIPVPVSYKAASQTIRMSRKNGLELTSTEVRDNLQAIKINRQRVRPLQPKTVVLQQNNQQNNVIVQTCARSAPHSDFVNESLQAQSRTQQKTMIQTIYSSDLIDETKAFFRL